MGTEPKQDPDNGCGLRERVLRAVNMSGYWGYKPHIPERWRGLGLLEISEDNVAAGKNVNVAVAAYVTTQARLKLYEYLSKLGQSALNCDTHSAIFVQKDNPRKVKTGEYLGDLNDELEDYGSGSFIQEFVSGGPKNYAFSVFSLSTGKHATKCKVKGITLNYENSKVVNFTALRNMILESAPAVHVHNPKKIKKQVQSTTVLLKM